MKIHKTGLGILLTAILAMAAVSLPASAAAKDSNRDRIPDRWEKKHNLTLKKNQRKLDQDRDGLRNRGEWQAGTNPRDKDSDNDGIKDGKEHAGVIAAYDAAEMTLTINLYGGGKISGSVIDRTRVRCDSGEATGEEPGELRSPATGTGGDEAEDGPRGHEKGPRGEGHCNGDCSLDDLAVGVEVFEADVKYTSDGPVFTGIAIEKAAAEE